LLTFVLVFFLPVLVLFLPGGTHAPTREVWQKVQFNAMNAAAELFANEFDGHPPSDTNDPVGQPSCGAMKLAEALMGQDLQGFHTKSAYRADGLDRSGVTSLYPPKPDRVNLMARKGPFLQAENANA
jgi:hypothetical protein